MSTIVNRRDLDFLLYETLGLNELLDNERFSDYDRESIDAIFDLSQSIAEDHFQPFAAKLDANEPEYVDGKVEMIDEVAQALDAYRQAGLFCGYWRHAITLDGTSSTQCHVCVCEHVRFQLYFLNARRGEYAACLRFKEVNRKVLP